MAWDLQDSNNIYEELRHISSIILPKVGCHTEPHEVNGKGHTRTVRWDQHPTSGQRRYKGIIYHYTAGVSTLGALAWGNSLRSGNDGSSWHALICDRMLKGVIGDEWAKIDDELRRLFPVPTLITADFRWGTWHGNWTNRVTLGVENRNGGYWGYKKAKGGLKGIGKEGVEVNGRIWEPYTREQMVCNINFGRMANGWIDGQLDPDWVISHQCIWATKADTGLVYPMHNVRNAVFDDVDPIEYEWLAAHPMAPDENEDDDAHWETLEPQRHEAEEDFVKWVQPSPEVEAQERDRAWIAAQLYKIGFNTGPELPDKATLRKQVRWFQRSTSTFRKNHPEWVLTPDGIVGPKTEAGLIRRLKQLKLAA